MYTLVQGDNEIQVTVTSESGVDRTYTLIVTKLGSRNNNLSSLEVVGHTISPVFNKNTTSYNLTVEYEVETVDVKATLEDEKQL